jgi:flavorubredoxin
MFIAVHYPAGIMRSYYVTPSTKLQFIDKKSQFTINLFFFVYVFLKMELRIVQDPMSHFKDNFCFYCTSII